MKKRIISILCALALVVAMLPPVTASAAAPTTLTVGGTDVLNGGYWTTDESGTLTEASADNYNVHYDGYGTLTLKDATINGTDTIGHVGTGIYAEGDLTIVLEGSSTVTGVQDPNGDSQSIRVSGNLTIQGGGSLTAQGAETSSGSSYGIFVIGSFTQQGGSVTAIGGNINGNYTSTGLYVYGGTVTAQDGTLTATGGDTSGSSYGISMSSSSSVTVGSATVTVTGGTGNYSYGLYVNPSSSSVSPSVTLSGSGSLTARSGSGTDTAVGIYLNNIWSSTGSVTVGNGSTLLTNSVIFRDSSFNENPLAPTGDGSWLIYGQSGQTSAVGGNYTLEENLTIENGNTLTIPAGSILTVPQGKTLTVNGTLNIANQSSLAGEGTLDGSGTFNLTNPNPDISGSDTLTYDGTDQFSKFTLTAPSGTVDVMGKAFNISDSASTVGWSLVTQVIKDAGTYTVTASHTDGRTIQKQVTVNKATSSIAFNDYPLSYTYTGQPLANPTADQLTLTGAGYNDVTFTWYKGSVADANKLDSAPADAGSYYLVASISESNNTSGSSTTSGAITVNPKEVSSPTIELSGTSFEYTGSEIRPEVVSVKDGETVIPASEYTVEYANTTNVGDNATVTIVDKDGGNYTVNGSTTFQITKASATVTQAPTANTLTYNGSAQELVTAGSAEGGTLVYSLMENGTYTEAIPTGTSAGDYTVWYKVVGDANHSDTQPVEVKITIAKAMPSVTDVQVSDSIGTIYDTTDISTITLTYTGSAGTVKLTEGQTLHAGSGTYTWTFTPADTANYNNATGTITLTVAEDTVQSIAVTTPPTKITYTYGESLDITGMVVTATYASGATKPVTADMTVTPTELTTSVTALTISYGGKTTIQAITVNPKAVNNPTITLSDYSFEFTGKAITPTVVSVKDGETVIPAGEYTVSYSNNVNVGSNAALTITDKAGGNYTVSGSTTFEITKVKATVTKAPTANTLTYTGQPQVLVTAGTATGGEMQYSTEENGTYDTAIPTGTNVGSYSVWYKVAGDKNHSDTQPVEVKVTISQASIADATVSLSQDTFTYNGQRQTPTVTVTLGDTPLTESDYTVTYSGNCIDAGTYTVTVTGKGNYSGTAASKTYTIEKATVTPSISGTASKTYDGTTEATGLTITLNGVVSDDTVTAVAASYTYNSANVGESKTVIASGITLSSEDAGNYTLSVETAQTTGTITPAALTVTADTKSKTYGEADPELTYTATGLKGDDTLTGELSRETGENVGEHAITQGSLAAGSNYTLTFTGAKFTITARPVTLSWSTPTSFTYDGQLHSVTAEVTNAVDGDTFTLAYEDNAKTDAGTYTAKVTGLTGTDAANYTLTGATTTQAWRIVRATVTITVKDQTARVGDAVPTEFDADDYTVTGLLGDDTLTKQPTLQVVTTSDLVRNGRLVKTGKLVISAAGAEAENYDILYKTGTLTVLEALPTRYPIYVEDTAHGTVTVDNRAEAGETVTITVTPEEGYSLSSLTVTDRDGSKLELAPQGGGKYTFEMPSSSVTIRAVFVPEELPFVDVKPTDWFYDAVSYVYWSSMMDGVSADRFAPDSDVTRAMVWTVLARIDGETITGSDWAEDARAWAMENGISDGTNPMSPVTREQLAAMLYRYAGSPAVSGSLSDYPDAEQVSDWARDAMLWATENGIINGIGGKLSPASGATRAQLATMLMRFAARLS